MAQVSAMSDPSKSAYRKWYENNREEFNRKRREKYKKDKEYREKALSNTRRYRESGPAIPMEDPLYREKDGKYVEVFRISTVGYEIGRSVQAIRQWEKSKIIPKPLFDGGHRVYTKHQIKLMKRVVQISDKYRYNQEKYTSEIEKLSETIANQWGK